MIQAARWGVLISGPGHHCRELFMLKIIAVTLALAALPLAVHADGLSPQGLWSRGDGKARVEIAPCGADLCAVNTWIRPGVNDEKVGDKLIMTVSQGSSSTWTGKAFDPQRNLHYKLTITVSSATAMTTSGCVFGGLLCKNMGWTRIDG